MILTLSTGLHAPTQMYTYEHMNTYSPTYMHYKV